MTSDLFSVKDLAGNFYTAERYFLGVQHTVSILIAHGAASSLGLGELYFFCVILSLFTTYFMQTFCALVFSTTAQQS